MLKNALSWYKSKLCHGTRANFVMVQDQTLSWYKTKLCHGTRPNFVMVQDQTLSWYKTKLCHGTRPNFVMVQDPNFVLINRFRFAGKQLGQIHNSSSDVQGGYCEQSRVATSEGSISKDDIRIHLVIMI